MKWSEHPQRKRLRLIVLARDRGICWLCGQPGATTVDHVVPRSRGGSDELTNLAAAHAGCNYARGNRTPAAPWVTREW